MKRSTSCRQKWEAEDRVNLYPMSPDQDLNKTGSDVLLTCNQTNP